MNKVQLIGHVGSEPTLKEFDKGGAVCNVKIATSEKGFKTKDGKEIPDRTEWHNVVFRNQLGKAIAKFIKVGDKIYIEGKLATRSYEKDGAKHYVTEIIVQNFEFMQKKSTKDDNNNTDAGGVDFPFAPFAGSNDTFDLF